MRHGSYLRNARVLVTGASGLVGRHCLPLLCRQGAEVHAVTSRLPATDGDMHWHQADLLDHAAIGELIARVQPQCLLHLAWLTAPGEYRTSLKNAQWAAASLELVRQFATAGGQRAVLAGTCLEYAESPTSCREESTPLEPMTPYGRAKLDLWRAVEELARRTAISVAWGRIFYLYGPHEDPRRFVASVVRSVLAGQEALCSSGEQVRDYLHVADVAAALVRLLDADVRGAVNIASGQMVAVREVAQQIGRLLSRPELVRLGALPAASGEPRVLAADVTRLRNEVEWRPAFDLRRGLQHTIDWWRACAVS